MHAVTTAVNEFRPEAIINAAAYTDVDRAESNPQEAFAANRDGAKNIATASSAVGARLIHISTDYVFDGKRSTPYPPSASPNPINQYGASKLAGELEVLRAGTNVTIVRTSWVYAETGRNFLTRILGLLSAENAIRVVTDQSGTPTAASDLAQMLWVCARDQPRPGILHWTNAGVASWYDFAVAIRELAEEHGLVDIRNTIVPISSAEYPAKARRPAYSVLDASIAWKSFGTPRHWREALAETVNRYRLLETH